LPVAILALVLLLCSTSTVSAWVSVSITPDERITSTQISEFWSGVAPCEVCHDDKTVTYTVTVETDSPWLNRDLPFPYTTGSWAWI
jgi:cytochrome c553